MGSNIIIGLWLTITRTNLGRSNEIRSYRIFDEFVNFLIQEARRSCYKEEFEVGVDTNNYALDSTTIDL